jgi:hypothetical protein
VHGHFSWSILGLHLVRGPKAFNMQFYLEIGPLSVTMNKSPMTWDNFVVHDVNNPSCKKTCKN